MRKVFLVAVLAMMMGGSGCATGPSGAVPAATACKPDEVCGDNCNKTAVKCGNFTCDCKKGTAGDKCAVYNCK